MAVQTVVNDTFGIGYAGQIADGCKPYVRSARAEDVATTAIIAGAVVLRGTNPADQVLAITNGATVDASTVAGLVVLETSKALEDSPVVEGGSVSVMRFGVMKVLTTTAVTAGLPLFVGNETAQLGEVTDTTGTGLVQVPGCRFLTSTSGAGIAHVMVNLS